VNNNNKIFDEIIAMGISTVDEAVDLLIALYPYISRLEQASIITMFKDYFYGVK
jgi:hypothetical protein